MPYMSTRRSLLTKMVLSDTNLHNPFKSVILPSCLIPYQPTVRLLGAMFMIPKQAGMAVSSRVAKALHAASGQHGPCCMSGLPLGGVFCLASYFAPPEPACSCPEL